MPDAPAVETAPAPTEITQTPAVAAGAHDEAFGSIDAIASADGAKPKAAPAKAAVKPDAPKVDKPNADKPKDNKQEPAKAPDKKDGLEATDTPPEKMAPKALRDAYSKSKQEASELRKQLEAAKTAAPKEFKVDDAPEYKSLKEKHAALLKQNEELENTVRYTNYEASKEFKEKYQEPYEKAATLAVLTARQLNVTTEDPATGQVSSRKMTDDEFWDIARKSDEEAALDAAEKLFGKGNTRAARIVDLRQKVIDAESAAQRAKEEFKKTSSERAKQMQEQQEGFTKAQKEAFERHREEGLKNPKYASWFTAEEGDEKGAELLNKGKAWADKVFGELPPEDAPKYHAALYNKAASFDHVVHKLNSTKSALADALEKLKQYEASSPGGGEAVKGRITSSDDEETIEGGLNRIYQLATKD